MAGDIDVFDFALSDQEMTRIAGLDAGVSAFFDHRDHTIVSRLGRVRAG